jgi:biopolymer transport protein ExbD
MNFRGQLDPEREGFQLAPLIDIVFLLLVFFVVTSALQQLERQMDLNVPTAEHGRVPRQRAPYYINVTKDGTIIISNRTLTHDELKAWLKDLHDAYGASPPPVVIRADRDTAFQHFVKVLDACADANIRNVAYANIEESRSGG